MFQLNRTLSFFLA